MVNAESAKVVLALILIVIFLIGVITLIILIFNQKYDEDDDWYGIDWSSRAATDYYGSSISGYSSKPEPVDLNDDALRGSAR